MVHIYHSSVVLSLMDCWGSFLWYFDGHFYCRFFPLDVYLFMEDLSYYIFVSSIYLLLMLMVILAVRSVGC